MSYILEALKRAQTERAGDRLPDLLTPAIDPLPTASGSKRRSPAVLWVAIGVAAGLLFAAAAQLVARRTAPEAAAPVSQASGLPPAAAPVPGSPAAQAPPSARAPDAVLSPAAALPSTQPATRAVTHQAQPTPPTDSPAPTAAAGVAESTAASAPPAPPFLPPPARSATAATVRPGDDAAPASRPATSPPPAPAASAAAPLPPLVALRDLPDAVRQQLPPLKLGGSIYSERRADRLLIVDGQVAREGDLVAPGLVLEHVGPRSAVFRHGQLRFELPL